MYMPKLANNVNRHGALECIQNETADIAYNLMNKHGDSQLIK